MGSISFPCFIKDVTLSSDGITRRKSVKLPREPPGLLPQGMTSASSLKTQANSTFLYVRSHRTASVPHHTILSNFDFLQAVQCPLQNRVLFELLLTLVSVTRSEERAVVHLHLLRVVGRLFQPLLVQLLLDDLVSESVLLPARRGLSQLDLLGDAEGRCQAQQDERHPSDQEEVGEDRLCNGSYCQVDVELCCKTRGEGVKVLQHNNELLRNRIIT